jgi:hypothetical protein
MGTAPLEVYFTSLAESPSFQGTQSLHDELGTGLLHHCGASLVLVILLGLLTCRLHPRTLPGLTNKSCKFINFRFNNQQNVQRMKKVQQ